MIVWNFRQYGTIRITEYLVKKGYSGCRSIRLFFTDPSVSLLSSRINLLHIPNLMTFLLPIGLIYTQCIHTYYLQD